MTTRLDREIEIDNAAERERVRVWWADRAPVLAWLAFAGMVGLCLLARGW